MLAELSTCVLMYLISWCCDTAYAWGQCCCDMDVLHIIGDTRVQGGKARIYEESVAFYLSSRAETNGKFIDR